MYFSTLFLTLICRIAVDFFASGRPSYTRCCHVLTLALARLSCTSCVHQVWAFKLFRPTVGQVKQHEERDVTLSTGTSAENKSNFAT